MVNAHHLLLLFLLSSQRPVSSGSVVSFVPHCWPGCGKLKNMKIVCISLYCLSLSACRRCRVASPDCGNDITVKSPFTVVLPTWARGPRALSGEHCCTHRLRRQHPGPSRLGFRTPPGGSAQFPNPTTCLSCRTLNDGFSWVLAALRLGQKPVPGRVRDVWCPACSSRTTVVVTSVVVHGETRQVKQTRNRDHQEHFHKNSIEQKFRWQRMAWH